MVDFISHEAPANKAQSLPVDLPPKLVGRDASLVQAYNQLKANKAVFVHGASGIGKTALAAALASAYTELPGGALWLNVENSPLDELIVRTGRAYNVLEISASSNPLGMVGAVASTFASHKPLLALDGKHDPKATADFIARCAGNLPVLIVSKDHFEGNWTPIELGKLEADAAITVLKQAAGLDDQALAEDELDELASILDYIPFALTIAGGTIRHTKKSPADYLSEFEKIPSSTGATPQLLALTIGFRSLSPAFQGIILLLGATLGVGASAELLSMMAKVPQDTIEQVMNQLINARLVERFSRYEGSFYRLHEISSTFAATWLKSQNRLDTVQGQVRDAVAAYVKKYSVNSPTAHDKLSAIMDLALAVARWSADQGERDVVNQLVLSLMQSGDFVNERGYVYELLKLRQAASSHTTAFPAYPTPPPPEEAVLEAAEDEEEEFGEEAFDEEAEFDEDELDEDLPGVRSSAVGSLWKSVNDDAPESLLELEEDEEEAEINGMLESAGMTPMRIESPVDELDRLRAAVRQAKQQGDIPKQADLLRKIGELEANSGLDTEAITTYTDLLAAYETLDEPEHILETEDTLSTLMVKTENFSAAVLHATRGIRLADELDDPETRMHLLMTLGDARQQNGEGDEAIRALSQALEIARTRDDSQNEALTLHKLGYAQLDSGQPDVAASNWEQALKLFRQQGKREYEGRVLGGLGAAYGELDRWEEAINFHTSALYIAREVKDKEAEALELGNLGYASVKANQLGQALLRYRQALHLAYQANNRENIVSNIVDIARLLVESRKHLLIAELLINDAIPLDPTDRDVLKLKERITTDKGQAIADGVEFLPVSGTAKDYAANAYKLLEQ
jgi:tetratricopeptide (TPR) repeat protein